MAEAYYAAKRGRMTEKIPQGFSPALRSSKRGRLSRQPPHVSFEFFPPKTPKGWTKLTETAHRLAEYQPDFVSVTFGAGGSANKRTLDACLTLRSAIETNVVPHLSCIGQTRQSIEEHLVQYRDEGFRTLLALRGDVPIEMESLEEIPVAEDGFRYANELVSFIKEWGGFHVFVGCYPEGHPAAPSLQTDIDNLIRKIDCGADGAVTQYFFNNAAYFHFVEELRRRGIDVPIVVGLMPVIPYEQVVRFSEKCGADVPLWIRKRMEGYQDDPESQFELGVEIAIRQAEELLDNGAPGIHFYTLNRPEATVRICEHLHSPHEGLGVSWQDIAYTEHDASGPSDEPSLSSSS